MLYLQWDILGRAIRTGSLPLFEQVLACFVSCQCSLLILNTAHLGVFHELHIETHQLHTDCRDGTIASHPVDPGEHIRDAALKGWWQPTCLACSIGPSRFSVSRLALSAGSAHRPAIIGGCLDFLSPMRQFCCENHVACDIVDNCNASRS